MSLLAKLGTLGFAGAGIGLPIPFVLRIGCGDPSTSKTWIRWVIGFPSLYCSGSKSRIYVSLAFKSGVVNKPPSDEKTEDLHLEGDGYDSRGKTVNFDEKVVGTGGQGKASDDRWKINIYGSGNMQIVDGDGEHGEDDIKCDSKPFEVTQWTYGEGDGGDKSWDKAVANVEFELENCKQIGGRKTCDIKIEDSVGLKWGTTVKPKAIFCASH